MRLTAGLKPHPSSAAGASQFLALGLRGAEERPSRKST